MNKIKIAYYISTGLMTALFGMGAVMYFAQHQMVSETFTALGYPTYIIYPLAIAKVLALVAIWTRKSTLLKDLAYAGLFYDVILAASAHIAVQDGEFMGAVIGLVLVVTSYAMQHHPSFSKAKEPAQTTTPSAA